MKHVLVWLLIVGSCAANAERTWICHFDERIPQFANELECESGSLASMENGSTCCYGSKRKLREFNVTEDQLYFGSQWGRCLIYGISRVDTDSSAAHCWNHCKEQDPNEPGKHLSCQLTINGSSSNGVYFYKGDSQYFNSSQFGSGIVEKYGAIRTFANWLGY